MLKRAGPVVVVFIACVWLNQSYGFPRWQRVHDAVFTDPRSHIFEVARYPFIFLYQRSGDEALYYGTAAQILGEPYEADVFDPHHRGPVDGALGYGVAPPSADGQWHAPWSEVPLEYTAPMLPFVLLPKILTRTFESFAKLFGATMGLCMVAAIALAVDIARLANQAGSPQSRLDRRWWLGAGLLLSQGALTIQRLDPIVALLMIVLWLGSKVFSPQYLTWGIPLVLAIPGSRGVKAIWIALLAMVLTQVFYRGFYDKVIAQEFVGVVTVLLRQGVLVALLLYVMHPFERANGPAADGNVTAVT